MSESSSATSAGAWDTSGEAGGDDVPFAPTIDWWSLTGAERLEELGNLRTFVARLVVDYNLDAGTVPQCWEQHEWAIRILDALYRSYLIATHPTQIGEALVGWHHNLVFACELLREMFTGTCPPALRRGRQTSLPGVRTARSGADATRRRWPPTAPRRGRRPSRRWAPDGPLR